ncbi:ATP-binding cassette domain-containing protein [Paenibacillus flagellatus]|uniref:ABC transporter n=1 Tax=Paenibacillus flagellatus TaxID=2211139 RepID=A0A2V5KCR2_9BACL|nr:ABC transporter ATP-binding protein [Paenibacillus flagellatus]PYI55753.1 ABC transporter [Paenibacillus flagellatus]
MTSKAPLRLERFVKRTGDFTLGPIDLALEPGLVYVLVGANGSGKSTLLKCVMNLMKPTSGSVRLFGLSYDEGESPVKRQAAYVPEPLEGCESFTLEEMGELIGGWYDGWDRRDFLGRAGAFRVATNKKYGKLSQGDRKKAALTLALGTRAPLLLLDEPTNGLDITSRNRLKQMLAAEAETIERTVLMTTHSVEDIRQFADCILLLKDGRLEGPYEKDELFRSWKRLWLSGDSIPAVSDIPGAVEYDDAPYPQLVTRDAAATTAYLASAGVAVTGEQPLAADELLEKLLNGVPG